MIVIATSYVNPDTDGVAGCMAIAALHQALDLPAVPQVRFSGRINPETSALLAFASISDADLEWDENIHAGVFVLIDTHHVRQLPAWVEPAKVQLIIDHHPAGDSQKFPNARLQNEKVGAACTLIAERYEQASIEPPVSIAILLLGGIISNTLEFTAPSTVRRDREMFKFLDRITGLGEQICGLLRLERNALMEKDTSELIAADVKIFDVGGLRLGIAQLEAPGASRLRERGDFWAAFRSQREAYRCEIFLVNLADLTASASLIATDDRELQAKLYEEYRLSFDRDVAWAEEIFLRKTHLVPALTDSSD